MLHSARLLDAKYGVLALTDTVLASGSERGVLRRSLRRVTKPALMPCLAAGVVAARPAGPGVGLVLCGEAFSWGGDVALLGEGRRSFLLGVGSFLAAHLCYASAFRARSSQPLLGSTGRRGWQVVGGLGAAAIGAVAAREDRALGVPVAAYALTLTTMVTAAAAVDDELGRDLTLTGALLFLVSDTLLGGRTFLLSERVPALDAAVMATYTAGQWCIGAGLRGPGSARAS